MDCCSKIPYLPIDIVNSILLELPVKSLLRLKIACKSWCCTIDDPGFIKSHLRKSFIDKKNLIFYHVIKGRRSCYCSIEVLSTEASTSADSKVVLIEHPNIRVCWNPVIRKYKRIQQPTYLLLLPKKTCFARPMYCFAYDFVAEDYKVLCVIQVLTTNTVHPHYVVEIYSVKKQLWRTIHDIFPVPTDCPLYLDKDSVSLNGIIHIIAISERTGDIVISFHLADEKFIVTPVPSKCGRRLKLRVLGDRVCVMAILDDEISIWSLEKDGKTWNNIWKFPTLGSGDVICVKENGNILWRMDDGRFIEYNVWENECTEFEVECEIGPLYVQSLVSLKITWD